MVKISEYHLQTNAISFFWSVNMEWNKLDVSLRESGLIKIFKSKLRQLNSHSMLVPIYNTIKHRQREIYSSRPHEYGTDFTKCVSF